jgi:WD40 repeat protein
MFPAQFFALLACAAASPPALDRHGVALPVGAVARFGSSALRGGHGFDLTPDGKQIITAGNPAWVDGGEVRVWDTASGKLLRSMNHHSAPSVVVSPDGKWLAAATGTTVLVYPVPADD